MKGRSMPPHFTGEERNLLATRAEPVGAVPRTLATARRRRPNVASPSRYFGGETSR